MVPYTERERNPLDTSNADQAKGYKHGDLTMGYDILTSSMEIKMVIEHMMVLKGYNYMDLSRASGCDHMKIRHWLKSEIRESKSHHPPTHYQIMLMADLLGLEIKATVNILLPGEEKEKTITDIIKEVDEFYKKNSASLVATRKPKPRKG